MPIVYIINPKDFKYIKIGKWSKDCHSLRKRYETYYGRNIEVYAYEVKDHDTTEQYLKDYLKSYSIDYKSELHKKEYLSHYLRIFKYYCKCDYIQTKKTISTIHKKIIKVCNKIIINQKLCILLGVDDIHSLYDTKIEKEKFKTFSDNIKTLYISVYETGLIRTRKLEDDRKTLLFDCNSFNSILKIFNMMFIPDKRKRINGKQISTHYIFTKYINRIKH